MNKPRVEEIGPIRVVDVGPDEHSRPWLYVSRRVDIDSGDGRDWHEELNYGLEVIENEFGIRALTNNMQYWERPSVSYASGPLSIQGSGDTTGGAAVRVAKEMGSEYPPEAITIPDTVTIELQSGEQLGYKINSPEITKDMNNVAEILRHRVEVSEDHWRFARNTHITVAGSTEGHDSMKGEIQEAIREIMEENPITGLALDKVELDYWR